MKKLLLLATMIIGLAGCKKDEVTISDQLNGTWEYRGESCYCAYPNGVPNSKPGNGSVIKFDNGDFQQISNGKITQTGKYTVSTEVINGKTVNRIIYDAPTTGLSPFFFEITEGKKLRFFGTISAAADGLELYYERL